MRVLAVAAPLVWLAAFLVNLALYGPPLSHDTLFIWILFGLAAISLRAWRSWGVLLLEWLPLMGLLVLYDYLRGAVSVDAMGAHVWTQVDFDKALFGGQLPTVWLQHHLYHPGHIAWYDVGIWCTYLTHFLAIWVVAVILWKFAHDRFRQYVALTVCVTLAAFLTYWLYPAQPPWMASDLGEIPTVYKIVPTVWGHFGLQTAQSLFETGNGLVNLVAAMPSLHASYPLMLMLFFWRDGVRYRIGLGLYALAMAFALVYGGEHFVTDILVGWTYTVIAYLAVCVAWPRWRARRAAAAPAPASVGAAGDAEAAGA